MHLNIITHRFAFDILRMKVFAVGSLQRENVWNSFVIALVVNEYLETYTQWVYLSDRSCSFCVHLPIVLPRYSLRVDQAFVQEDMLHVQNCPSKPVHGSQPTSL